MDMYDAMFSAGYILCERVARQVFDVLGENGPVLAMMDRNGNCWASDPEAFDRWHPGDTVLGDLWARVDDGFELASTPTQSGTVVTAQLATEHTTCGYLVLILPDETQPTDDRMALVEALFGQIGLVARLVEASTLISDTQMKCYSAYGTNGAPAN